ncbi:unnamed protein product [Linum trigynum]|uniref:Uncharacterized protein n=1 Tax=Linum trigynum TaxID=586398 RepID=A0AAV2FPL9_9ROSI
MFSHETNFIPAYPYLLQGSGNCQHCARLIKSLNPARVQGVHEGEDSVHWASADGRLQEARDNIQTTDDSGPSASFVSASSLPPLGRSEQQPEGPLGSGVSQKVQNTGKNSDTDVANSDASKTSSLDSVPIPRVRDASTLEAGLTQGNGHPDYGAFKSISKKLKTDGSFSLNSMCPDKAEVAVFDLEELVNQIKWIKRILEVGMPLTDPVRPSWKFLEHEAPSIPK